MTKIALLQKIFFASVVTSLVGACGGGGGDSPAPSKPTQQPAANAVPTVNAGADQDVKVENRITLTGTAADSDGSIQSYVWQQVDIVAGSQTITLMDTDKAVTYFDTNFTLTEAQSFTFELTVTDNDGATSNDRVTVTLQPLKSYVDIALPGTINHARLTKLSETSILVTGGCEALSKNQDDIYSCAQPSKKAYLFDLTDNSFSPIADTHFAMPFAYGGVHSETQLNDGRVLFYTRNNWLEATYNITNTDEGSTWITTTDDYGSHYGELYDPNSQTFAISQPMSLFRENAMPVTLVSGEVLVFGGIDSRKYEQNETFHKAVHTSSIDAFNPADGLWTILEDVKLPVDENDLLYDRILTAALPDNKVLLVGGLNTVGPRTNKAYIFDRIASSVTEIASYSPPTGQGLISNSFIEANHRRELTDGSFCMLANGSGYPMRFDPVTSQFNYDIDACLKHVNPDNYWFPRADISTYINIEPSQTYITPFNKFTASETSYQADCDCYEYNKPMTIRIITH